MKKTELNCYIQKDKIDILSLEKIKPDLIISYGYRYLIKPEIIYNYFNKIINLHIALLPWNKGADPNIWSFLENTPKGVSIHLIDEEIDTGDILLQKKVFFNEDDETLSSTYNKLHVEIQKLFKENYEDIINLKILPIKQIGRGSVHYAKDFKKISFLIKEKGWDTPIRELKENYIKYLQSNENV